MKNLKRILSFFIVMGFMFVMFGLRVGVKATDTTVTYAVSTTSIVTSDVGSAPAATYSQTHGTKCQATEGNSFTLTVPFSAGVIIKSVTMSMKSNSSKGAGTLDISLGGKSIYAISSATKFNNAKWYGSWSTSYVDVVKELNVTTYSNCNLVIHIAATENSLYCQSYKIVYEEISDPFIGVSGESSLMVGGNTTSLTATPKNILPEPASYSWVSSNPGVATVSSSGVVTPVSMGTTNITATASGETSNSFVMKVYPSNAASISIATASQIATLAGTEYAPYKYISTGTIASIEGTSKYTLEDASGSITVYKSNHEKVMGDVVTIKGDLINYSGNSLQYTNIEYCYNVTFNTDGGSGSFGPYNNVVSGTTISNPGTPTKPGNTFIGWFNGDDEWNFANDTVTGALTLTAKWASDAAQTAINNALESTNAYMSLAYGYTFNKVDNPSNYTLATSISHLSAGDSVIIVSKLGEEYFALTNGTNNITCGIEITNGAITSEINSDIEWTLGGNYTDGWTLKNGGKYINNGDSTTISLHASNSIRLNFVLSGNNSYFINSDRVMMVRKEDAKDAVIRNYKYDQIGNPTYANEVYVFVKQANAKYSVREVDFRIRCAIDEGLGDLNEDYAVTFGIEVSAGGNTVKYANGSGASFQTADGKQFVTLDLGDMLNTNYANLDTEFTIRAYVEYDGAYFYSTNIKTYSVKGMVENYYKVQHIDAVSGLKEILENYGYTFE